VLAAATVAKAIAAVKHAKAIGSRKRNTPALPAGLPLTVASSGRAEIIALVWPCGRALDPHVVGDGCDAADALRDGNRAVGVGARGDEAAQLHPALECFDNDLGRLQGGFFEDGGLDTRGDGRVVEVLAGAFVFLGRGATGQGGEGDGGDQDGNAAE
jgi:hypothetical protein